MDGQSPEARAHSICFACKWSLRYIPQQLQLKGFQVEDHPPNETLGSCSQSEQIKLTLQKQAVLVYQLAIEIIFNVKNAKLLMGPNPLPPNLPQGKQSDGRIWPHQKLGF